MDSLVRKGGLRMASGKHKGKRQAIKPQVAKRQVLPVADAMQAGLRFHEVGQFAQAEEIYRRVLDAVPGHADALHLLGLIRHQQGDAAKAAELVGQAIDVNPSNPIFHNNLGTIYKTLNRYESAAGCYQNALRMKPDYWEAHFNLGNILCATGRMEDAVDCYRAALAIKGDMPDVCNNLGLVFNDLGRFADAVIYYSKALESNPGHVNARCNLGNVLRTLGAMDEAIDCFQLALAQSPDFVEPYVNLSAVLNDLGRCKEAVTYCEALLTLQPDHAAACNNLGVALRALGQHDAAIAYLRRAIVLNDDYGDPHNNLALTLQDRGKFAAAAESFRDALARSPDSAYFFSNLLCVLQYDGDLSPEEVLAEHRRFAERFESPLKPHWRPHGNERDPARRLKVGYVSPDFRNHAVAYFIEPVLANHDRRQVEVFCYYSHVQQDEVTQRLKTYADVWVECSGMTDERLAERIRADGIDILVDLAGHTARNRLLTFARKPAPIQMTYLGYPGTSGLEAMDYRLTDGCADPAGAEAYYTETLLRLPDSLWCYRPPSGMPEVGPLPALANGYVTFGSLNNYNKIDDLCLQLWSVILRSVPDARLLMVTVPEGEAREKLLERFEKLGVSSERLKFQPSLSSADFHQAIGTVDIALDPLAINGATTTCESIWLGVPVVALVGTRFAQRAGLSILSAAGLGEFTAGSAQAYVDLAIHLATNLPLLAELRAGLRAHVAASALVDEVRFTRNLEGLYREVWTRWCGKAS
jgi:predicted O-linked N-acetylglucosamine transferase (SPINDLY family)